MPQNSKLNVKQIQAVQLTAQGMRCNLVATQVGIDPGTLSRWRRMPSFQQELSKLLEQSERECVDSFRAIKTIAIERLAALLDSKNQTIALKAIELVLSKIDLRSAKVPPTDPYSELEKAHWNSILDELLRA
ncbi:hypothetical protein [Polaromonas sp. OV174]|uniref:hypothetical protein n=1 Tax=Polaromonas sp. OV174 TaxID=1855300 RepID=UPI0015A5B2A6|nr:hypothetical protein [Polaromonas sp. OV174]